MSDKPEQYQSKYEAPKPQPVARSPNVSFDSTVAQPQQAIPIPCSASKELHVLEDDISCSGSPVVTTAAAAAVASATGSVKPVSVDSAISTQSSVGVATAGAATARVAVDSAISTQSSVGVATAGADPASSTGTDKQASLLGDLRNFKRLPPASDKKPALTTTTKLSSLATDEGIATVESGSVLSAAGGVGVAAELKHYKAVVAAVVHCVAFTGDANQAMRLLVRQCPDALLRPDSAKYQESPLGQALLRGHADWAREFLAAAGAADAAAGRSDKDDAGRQELLKSRVLGHRNSARHTLLMLAVDLLDGRPDADDKEAVAKDRALIEQLLAFRPAQVHECYDAEGRNVLHHCAADNRPAALRAILNWLAANAAGTAQRVAAALSLPDGRCRTPVQYMAEAGSVAMLQAVADFAAATGVKVNFNWRWQAAFDRTPLMLAAVGGHLEACRWLTMPSGAAAADANMRSVDTKQTALDMAQEAGHADIVALLKPLTTGRGDNGGDDDDLGDEDDDCGFEEGDEGADDSEDEGVGSKGESAPNTAADAASASTSASAVNDLDRLNSDTRSRLCEGLRAAGRYDEFLGLLKDRVPQLTTSRAFLELSTDPVYLAISLMAGSVPEANCGLLVELLQQLGLTDLASEVKQQQQQQQRQRQPLPGKEN